jgi:hypothetical protein
VNKLRMRRDLVVFGDEKYESVGRRLHGVEETP